MNSACVKDVFPLSLLEECLDTLAWNKWYSKLDANSVYWQVKINKEDRSKPAFVQNTAFLILNFTSIWAIFMCSCIIFNKNYWSEDSICRISDEINKIETLKPKFKPLLYGLSKYLLNTTVIISTPMYDENIESDLTNIDFQSPYLMK